MCSCIDPGAEGTSDVGVVTEKCRHKSRSAGNAAVNMDSAGRHMATYC